MRVVFFGVVLAVWATVCARAQGPLSPLPAGVVCDNANAYCVVGWQAWPLPFPQFTTSAQNTYYANYTFYVNPYGPLMNTTSLVRAHACRQNAPPPVLQWVTQVVAIPVTITSWCTDAALRIAVDAALLPAFLLRASAVAIGSMEISTIQSALAVVPGDAGLLTAPGVMPPALAPLYVNMSAQPSPAVIDIAVLHSAGEHAWQYTGAARYTNIAVTNVLAFGASAVRVASAGVAVVTAQLGIDGLYVANVGAFVEQPGGFALSLVGTYGRVTVGPLGCVVTSQANVAVSGAAMFGCAHIAMLRAPGLPSENGTSITVTNAVDSNTPLTIVDVTALVSYASPLLPKPMPHQLIDAPTVETTVHVTIIVTVTVCAAVSVLAVFACCEIAKHHRHALAQGGAALLDMSAQHAAYTDNAARRAGVAQQQLPITPTPSAPQTQEARVTRSPSPSTPSAQDVQNVTIRASGSMRASVFRRQTPAAGARANPPARDGSDNQPLLDAQSAETPDVGLWVGAHDM